MMKRILMLALIALLSIMTTVICTACSFNETTKVPVIVKFYIGDDLWKQTEAFAGDLVSLPFYGEETDTHYYAWLINGEGEPLINKFVAEENTSLFVKQIEKATITFKVGENIVDTKRVKHGEKINLEDIIEETETQYYKGWSVAGGNGALVKTCIVKSNITFVATGITDKAVVTYIDGNSTVAVEYVRHGAMIQLNTLSDTDTQAFLGWKINGEGNLIKNTLIIRDNTRLIADFTDSDWVPVIWNEMQIFDSNKIWKWTNDGKNYTYYYSDNSEQRELDISNKTWKIKTWQGLPSDFDGSKIWTWTDGTSYKYYHTLNNVTHELIGNIWTLKEDWEISSGSCVWYDGTNYYHLLKDAENNACYILNNGDWESISLSGIPSNLYFDASKIWTDGEFWYLSVGTKHYKKKSNYWSEIRFNNTDILGNCVWSAGGDIYCTYFDETKNESRSYLFNKATQTWVKHDWLGKLEPVDGSKIWTDGDYVYYSFESSHYKFNQNKN